jgi:DNA-binding transcriptional regulator LsrR (DeoR family)
VSDLSTRAEVAAQLRISERTLRRLLPRVPGLVQIKAGRLVLFDARNVDRIMEALQCPCTSASVEKFGTRGVLSVSAAKRSKSPSTAQDAAREAMQKLRQRHEKAASEPTSSPAQKGVPGSKQWPTQS